ncbi:MAG: hypothetical protein ABJL67_20090 [Sulfitobacter sp.]
MRNFAASILLMLFAGVVNAQNCPDFFRFVDFGLEGHDGVIYRGGPIFRAESLNGSPLLLRDRTKCRAIRDIASDGHGNPIPVVTSINYDPVKTGIDLSELQLSLVEDAAGSAEQNALAHRAVLDRSETERVQGPNFICARHQKDDTISCQLVSPYPGNIALVIYCTAWVCEMPVLAVYEQIQIGAKWPSNITLVNDLNTAGMAISDKVQKIYTFLDPLS